MNFNINYKLQDLDNGEQIDDLIVLDSFMELKRRIQSSVFSNTGESYDPDFQKFCISSMRFSPELRRIFLI